MLTGDSYSHALMFLGKTSHPTTLLSLSPPSLAGHKGEVTSLVSGTRGGSECGLTIPASLSGLATSRGCPLGLLHPQKQHTCRGPGDSFLGSDCKSFFIGPN